MLEKRQKQESPVDFVSATPNGRVSSLPSRRNDARAGSCWSARSVWGFTALLAVGVLVIFSLGSGRSSPAEAGAQVDELLVKFKPNASPQAIAALNRSQATQQVDTIPALGVRVLRLAPRRSSSDVIAAYSRSTLVQYAEPNFVATAIGTPNDSYFGQQWSLTKVQAPEAWDLTTGLGSVKIAVLDTGLDPTHPELSTKIVEEVNFSASQTTFGVHSHGTHVAGISAAATNNENGVAGVGYNSSLMNVKVLGDDGSGTYSAVAQGIVWATDNGANVINMSLGGTSPSTTLSDAVNYAWNRGVVVVAAAGNSGTTSPTYPAYHANVIAVAATDSSDALPSWSNRGDWVDVAAPGVSIYSTVPFNGYQSMSGTSMASPHVAGLAGLVFALVSDTNGNGWINDEARNCIEANTDTISAAGVGSGRINALKALQCLNVGPSPTPSPSPTSTPQNPLPTATPTATQTPLPSTTPVISKEMWIQSIVFDRPGKNLRATVSVSSASGPLSGATVGLSVNGGGKIWNLSGTSGSNGSVSFMLGKASAGSYVATITRLSLNGYTWDQTKGIKSTTYALTGAMARPD